MWLLARKVVILQPISADGAVPIPIYIITRVLGKPRKKQENEQNKETSERAVYAFQHPLLRLSDSSKRARNKANRLRASILNRWSHRIPSELHYQ